MALAGQITLDDLGIPLFDVNFCVLDLETTGGSANSCEITEIGAVKYRGGEVLGTFQTLVNPGIGIPPFITILTGITQAMVCEAPRIESVLPAFLDFCRDSVLVGHNVRFDLSFLDAAARRLAYPLAGSEPLQRRVIDTVGLARRLIRSEVRDLTLATLASHLRSPIPPNHRALDDARATAHVFHSLLERAGSLGVTGLDDLLQLPTARGSAYYSKIRLTDALPRRPGVYFFIDRNGTVIYVGKAENLRTRVRSYFYGDERRQIADMLRQLHRIDHRVCANNLEAEVTELRLIHAHRPRFNQRSRPPKRQLFVKITDERFPRLSQAHGTTGPGLWWLGPFRSKPNADRVMEAIWAATMIRRCSGKPGSRSGRCAPAQLGVASCPCAGDADPGEYRQTIDEIVRFAVNSPARLLEPLEVKMRRLAAEQRFEEAAQMRDRHRALVRALEQQRAWQALAGAGRVELESTHGDRVVIEQGVLIAAWGHGQQPPLLSSGPLPLPSPVPATVAAAEEAHLIWRWMTTGEVRVIDCSNPLILPASPIPHLRAA
ncbi:MAG: DEDD exonuclease domain-containing protein [Acidimicrobiia bacterium]